MTKQIQHITSGKLIICPTPIGNLGDITQRMRDALTTADAIYAEDTRVTGKLLRALDISNTIERLDETVMLTRAEAVLARVRAGETVAYCSDAGMPGVSDPGLRLVALAQEQAVPVEVLPGPTAVPTAYVASGCTNPRFYFGGFLPRKHTQRVQELRALQQIDAALIFYESPNRLVESLQAIAEVFPARSLAVCRELTKLHEEVVRLKSQDMLNYFQEREQASPIKGEIVLVIDGISENELKVCEQTKIDQAQTRACELKHAGLKDKEIAKALVKEFGISRNNAYQLAMQAAK